MPTPGHPTTPITLAGKDGLPYVRNVSAYESGVPGLIVHHIPEFPNIYTTSMRESGLRIGRARFPSVKSACDCAIKHFGGVIDFRLPLSEITIDPRFAICLSNYVRESCQVPRDMSGVIRTDLADEIMSGEIKKNKNIRFR